MYVNNTNKIPITSPDQIGADDAFPAAPPQHDFLRLLSSLQIIITIQNVISSPLPELLI